MDLETTLRSMMMQDAESIHIRHQIIARNDNRIAGHGRAQKTHKLFEPRAKQQCDRCFALRLPADLIGTHLGGIRARVCRGGCRDFI